MLLFKVFGAICFTAFCAAQDPQNEPPVLSLKSAWLEVFPSEKVKFACTISSNYNWTISWYRDEDLIQEPGSSVTFGNRMELTLTAEKHYSGKYSCQGVDKSENVSTPRSNHIDVKVYDSPFPTVSKNNDNTMFVGESVTFICTVGVSSGWEYVWYHNKKEIQAPSNNTYTIDSVAHSNGGEYSCKARRGKDGFFYTNETVTSLQISDPPTPSLKLVSLLSDVFENETVKFSCNLNSSDWKFTWYRNNKKLQGDIVKDGSSYVIPSVTQTDGGVYTCKAHHKNRTVTSGISNSAEVKVYENTPTPSLERKYGFDLMYVGEMVSFTCSVDVASGWQYRWFKDKNQLPDEGSTISITLGTSNAGKYSCAAIRGGTTSTDFSEEIIQKVLDPPTPSLKLLSLWSDVFENETVKFSCNLNSSDWKFTWYRNNKKLQEDMDKDGSSYVIPSVTQTDGGVYTCKAHHKNRTVTSGISNSAEVKVYENTPTPSLKRKYGFDLMYVGEMVNFTCSVDVASGWQYRWFKDKNQLPDEGSTISITLGTSNAGKYSCAAIRGGTTSTDFSEEIIQNVLDPPTPSLKLLSLWSDVFENETVEFSCNLNSSDWKFTWYRNNKKLQGDMDKDGSSYVIPSVTQTDGGVYTCKAHHKNRTVTSGISNSAEVKVYAEKPKPSITRQPDTDKLYTGESVSFECKVKISSGWDYHWYKDDQIHGQSSRLDIHNVSVSTIGNYQCRAIRQNTMYETMISEKKALIISEIPIPILKRSSHYLDVFPTETVKLSCGTSSERSDWNYTWYRDRKEVQADGTVSFDQDKTTLSINSASASHSGDYNCAGKLKSRPVFTRFSPKVHLHVYDTKPIVRLTQTPEHEVMHTGDSVSFTCHFNVSSGWGYVWYKDDAEITGSGNNYTISSVTITSRGSYKCQVKRGENTVFHSDRSNVLKLNVEERPQAKITLLTGWSEVFSTDTLLLKCEVENSNDMWNHTWFKEGQQINLPHAAKHAVTPQNDPEQSLYTCQGVRSGRPSYSKSSHSFKTKNLLLKRRVLLSISGCIFFGIIAVFLGCIALRVMRKPANDEYKPDEANLFLTMAQLKNCADAPCPLVDYVTEEALNAPSKEEEENGTICSETTPLPISTEEDQAVKTENNDKEENNGGLVSFKQ